MKEHQNEHTIHTNERGNSILEKTLLKGVAYALLFFFDCDNENTKKGALTMEFPFLLWPGWLVHNLLFPKYLLLNAFLNYIMGTMLIEWNSLSS
jgi:hypothetical protein